MFALLVAVPSLWTLLAVQAALTSQTSNARDARWPPVDAVSDPRPVIRAWPSAMPLATMIFGEFAPLISVWLIEVTGSPLAPSFYLMLGAVISVAAIGSIRRGASPRLS